VQTATSSTNAFNFLSSLENTLVAVSHSQSYSLILSHESFSATWCVVLRTSPSHDGTLGQEPADHGGCLDRGFSPPGLNIHPFAQDTDDKIMQRLAPLQQWKRNDGNDTHTCRHFVQDTSNIRPRLPDALHRPILPLGLVVQLRHEDFLHC
jgi:hypothetical protein